MSTYTIGETAERTGFSASALRYYEGIGLVEPATRSDAGYRLYDDAALARLAFIARAKQLGCSLEEITDLVAIWDGERCGPVQRRFHELLTAKIAGAQRQIDELTALVAQLHDAAGRLEGPAVDGPCSAECACMALSTPAPTALTHVPSAPVVCTAGGDDLQVRIDQISRLRAFDPRVVRTDHGLVLDFLHQPEVEAEVRDFTVAEKGCCAFWGFEVTTSDDRITLCWDGPPEVDDVLDQLAAFFAGDASLTALEGLL